MSTDRHGNHNHQPARRQAAELLWSLGHHINNDPSRRAAYGSPPTAGGAATASGGAYGAPNFTPSTGVPSSASGSQYSSTYGSSPAYSGEFSPLAQRNPFSFGSPSTSASRVSLPGSGNTTHPFAGPASPASLLSAGSNSGSASATGASANLQAYAPATMAAATAIAAHAAAAACAARRVFAARCWGASHAPRRMAAASRSTALKPLNGSRTARGGVSRIGQRPSGCARWRHAAYPARTPCRVRGGETVWRERRCVQL